MRIALAAVLAAATVVGIVASPSDARANGRFPESNAIFFATGNPQEIFLRTTFGLIVSNDRGKTWDWICDRTIGLAGVEDPMLSVTPDGTVIASTFQGLAVSRDNSCNYAFAQGALKDLVFIDLTSRPSTPGTIVAFASSYDGQDDAGLIFFKSTLFETKDEGKTFAPLGMPFDPTLLGETVDVTASDPDRIYVSAVRNPGTAATGVMLTSTNHGQTFTETAIPLVAPERAPFIAAVDPTNADRVYVRTSAGTDMPSRLLLSDDAGKTFRSIYTALGPLSGFALAPDGKKVFIGGPRDGVKVANTTDFQFVQKATIEIQCLTVSTDGLWGCSNEKSGFVVGLSTDDGATFEAKLHFCDIRGPLGCATGSTTHTECTLGGTASNASPPWPPQRAVLGCGGGVDLDAGFDGGGLGESPPPAGGEMEGGGGCALRAPSPTPVAALLAGVAAAIALVRRRRRR